MDTASLAFQRQFKAPEMVESNVLDLMLAQLPSGTPVALMPRSECVVIAFLNRIYVTSNFIGIAKIGEYNLGFVTDELSSVSLLRDQCPDAPRIDCIRLMAEVLKEDLSITGDNRNVVDILWDYKRLTPLLHNSPSAARWYEKLILAQAYISDFSSLEFNRSIVATALDAWQSHSESYPLYAAWSSYCKTHPDRLPVEIVLKGHGVQPLLHRYPDIRTLPPELQQAAYVLISSLVSAYPINLDLHIATGMSGDARMRPILSQSDPYAGIADLLYGTADEAKTVLESWLKGGDKAAFDPKASRWTQAFESTFQAMTSWRDEMIRSASGPENTVTTASGRNITVPQDRIEQAAYYAIRGTAGEIAVDAINRAGTALEKRQYSRLVNAIDNELYATAYQPAIQDVAECLGSAITDAFRALFPDIPTDHLVTSATGVTLKDILKPATCSTFTRC